MSQALSAARPGLEKPRFTPRLMDEGIMKEPQIAAQISRLLSEASDKGVEREVCGILEMYLNAMGGEMPLTFTRRLQALVSSTPAESSARVLEACSSLMRQTPMAAEAIPEILAGLAQG
jgi:hypothetical protein